MFECHEIFARLELVQLLCFAPELIFVVFGGLDGEADAAVVLVDLDDARSDFLVDLERVFDFLHALFADLRNVDESVHFIFQPHKGTEAGELGDLAGDEIAHFINGIDLIPRIVAELFDADRDALVFAVNLQHPSFDFVALLEQFGGVIDFAGPREVAHVDHSVEAFLKLHEGTVAGKVAHFALHRSSGSVLVAGGVPWIVVELTDAEANFLFVLVDSQNHRFDLLALLQHLGRFGMFFRPRKFGDMHESFNTRLELHKRAVRNEVYDLALDGGVDRILALDEFPRVLGFLLETE